MKSMLILIALLVGIISLQGDAFANNCSRIIRISHGSGYFPYQYINDNKQKAGLDLEMAEAILKIADCDYSFHLFPSRRAQEKLKLGFLDMMGAASVTDERKKFARFTSSYRDELIVMFTRDDSDLSSRLGSLADIANMGLIGAAGIGGWYGEEYGMLLQTEDFKSHLELSSSYENRIKKLLAGRVDVVIGDIIVGYDVAMRLGYKDEIIHSENIVNNDRAHFMLSLASTTSQDRDIINAAIKTFLSSPDHASLLNKYLHK